MLNGVPELEPRLLLASSRVVVDDAGGRAIQQTLRQGIDWTVFARLAVAHGVAGLSGHTLSRVAPDLVAEEILDALRISLQQTGRANRARFEELAGVLEALAADGVEAIPFKGPMLAVRAYPDPGLRAFGKLKLLVRDQQLAATIATLRRLGYAQRERLTQAHFERLHRLQGQGTVFNEATGFAIATYTRLASKLAIDIDYPALWRRAQRVELNGRSLLLLAPEDDFIVLAVDGCAHGWGKMKWACDIAAFISAHPHLDWTALLARARAQGCLRMVLLATGLARRYFDAAVPERVAAVERAVPRIERLAGRIAGRQWRTGEVTSAPASNAISLDRLLLHDGLLRRARYLARQTVQQLERWQGALAGSERALTLLPASTETRAAVRQHQKARVEAERMLAAHPDDAAAWARLGDAFAGLKRHQQAIACYDRVLEAAPYNTAVWKRRASALAAAGENGDRAEVPPSGSGDAEKWAVHAGRLFSTRCFAEAIEASDRALALDPGLVAAVRVGIHARQFACDWSRRTQDRRQIADGVRDGKRYTTPFFHRAISESEAEGLALARLCTQAQRRAKKPLWGGEPYRHSKIRIAYMSTDFRDHVVADMIAGCFEQHDRARFDITAISLGPNDRSAMRARIGAAVERFIDSRAMSDAQVARRIRELEIDVLIDLNGSSGENRPEILRHRPAPVQATYLGYPGTTAMPCVDYIIADRFVIPHDQRRWYTEQVVDLPHSFMPNDRTRPIAPGTPGRLEAGLPDAGFVFACHNHEYKLNPEIFDVWMRLLRAVDGSVMWLKSFNPTAVINLRREARARGVAPERLLFAPHVQRSADHLARLRLADLFLDTLPYNAHATACDALWAGLPVLTCLGTTFPGRVGASLLHALGLPELVTTSLTEYEALALALARDPGRLAALRATLQGNRETQPLFDTRRLTRNLETAYATMWQRREAGLAPASFSVEG